MLDLRAKARTLPEGWTPADDNRLRDAGGRYAAIRALSDDTQIAETVLLARWHKLRQGAERARAHEDRDFAALMGIVSPKMRALCRALRGAGPMGGEDLACLLDVESGWIAAAVAHYAERLAAQGLFRIDVAGPKSDPRYSLHHLGGGGS